MSPDWRSGCVWAVRTLGVLAIVGLSLVWAPAAVAAAPSARTLSVEVQGRSGKQRAVVVGAVEPNGTVTNAYADYGLLDSQWCTSDGREGTPMESGLVGLPEWEGAREEARVPLGLELETSYCAEIVAKNEDGSAYGGQLDFKTVAPGTLMTAPEEIPLPAHYFNPYEKPNAGGAELAEIFSAKSVAEYWAAKRAQESAEAKAREVAERQALAAQAPAKPTEATELSVVSANIPVQSDGTALVKLKCIGGEGCAGKLTLTATSASRAKGKHRRSRTVTLGTVGFSVAAGATAAVKLKLGAAGLALLKSGHGRLDARLAIVEPEPGPAHVRSKSVRLVE